MPAHVGCVALRDRAGDVRCGDCGGSVVVALSGVACRFAPVVSMISSARWRSPNSRFHCNRLEIRISQFPEARGAARV